MKQLLIALAFAATSLPAQNAPPRQFELKAESPKFWELIDPDAKLEKIAGGFGFTEWEAPASEWLPGTYQVQIFVGLEWKQV